MTCANISSVQLGKVIYTQMSETNFFTAPESLST